MQSSEMHTGRSRRGVAPMQKMKLNRCKETNRERNVDDVARNILPQDVQHMVKYVITAIKRTIMHEIVTIKQSRVHTVDESDSEEVYVDVVTKQNRDKKNWILTLKVNDTNIAMKLDTGAQANVISETVFNKIRPRPKLHATKVRVSGYSGAAIPVKGKCMVKVTHKYREHTLAFIVVPKDVHTILGLSACERLNLVKRVLVVDSGREMDYDELMREYSDLFKGLGCLPGEHTIRVAKNVPPVINPCRKVPFALQKPLKEELDRMEGLHI